MLETFAKASASPKPRNFAALCWAIFRKRTTVLSELARCFVRPRRHIHRLKRIWQFVSNLRFNFQAVMDAICLHNLAMALWASGRRVALGHLYKAVIAANPTAPLQARPKQQAACRTIAVSRDTYRGRTFTAPTVRLSNNAAPLLAAHDVR